MTYNDCFLIIYEKNSLIEISHLKIIQALSEQGTLTKAAKTLCLTQSALSHQIRYLEKKLGVKLWQKEGRCLKLTQAGQYLLNSAQYILPVIKQTEQHLKAFASGKKGLLQIGVECYPCYEWLGRILGDFFEECPEVDLELIQQFQFSGFEALLNHHISLWITPDEVIHPQLSYQSLFDYELVLLLSKDSVLASKSYLKPIMLSNETLLIFPVEQDRLDIFNQFLTPAGIKPQQIKTIASIEIMVQLTRSKRGFCTLPDWLAQQYCQKYLDLSYLKIGKKGIMKSLYAGMRKVDLELFYLKKFIALAMR